MHTLVGPLNTLAGVRSADSLTVMSPGEHARMTAAARSPNSLTHNFPNSRGSGSEGGSSREPGHRARSVSPPPECCIIPSYHGGSRPPLTAQQSDTQSFVPRGEPPERTALGPQVAES